MSTYLTKILNVPIECHLIKPCMTEKEHYHHGDLHQALITAALALVEEKGIDGISLREVARRANVSHTAPYRHFANKEALLIAVADQGFQILGEQTQAAANQFPSDTIKQLQAIGVAYIQFAIAHPAHYRLMFIACAISFNQDSPCYLESATQAYSVLFNTIIRCQEIGIIRQEDPQQLAIALWSLVHGLALLIIDGQLAKFPTSAIESLPNLVTQMFLEGLLVQKE